MFYIYGYNPDHFACGPCINAKRLCEAKGYDYEFISVSKGTEMGRPVFNQEVIENLLGLLDRETPTGLTMPQIFYIEHGPVLKMNDLVHVGGFNELRSFKPKA